MTCLPLLVLDWLSSSMSEVVLRTHIQNLVIFSSFPGYHLHDKMELKYTYLEATIMNLEPDNATTKAHIGQVTKQLATQLQEYIAQHPHEKITRPTKMLLIKLNQITKKEQRLIF